MTIEELTALAACTIATQAAHEDNDRISNIMQEWFDEAGICPRYFSNGVSAGYFTLSPGTLERIADHTHVLPPFPDIQKVRA